MTFPLTPVVIWINPQFAGDVFPVRRRLQGGTSSTGSVGVDVQINVPNNAAASTLSSTLASSSTKLANDVKQSLINQGSPLSSASVSAAVEVYTGGGEPKGGESFSFSSLIYPAAMAGVVLAAAIAVCVMYCKLIRKSQSVIAIAPPDEKKSSNYETEMRVESLDSADSSPRSPQSFKFKFCGVCGLKFDHIGHKYCPECGTMRR